MSGTLLSGVQNGAPFIASATRAPFSFSKKSARWAALAKNGERDFSAHFCQFLDVNFFLIPYFSINLELFLVSQTLIEYFLQWLFLANQLSCKAKVSLQKFQYRYKKNAKKSAVLLLESAAFLLESAKESTFFYLKGECELECVRFFDRWVRARARSPFWRAR